MAHDLITILGPTASGKTALAVQVAARMGNAEILSADSRQLYRGMDIGTGKDLAEYEVEGRRIPCHLIDIAPAGERRNLFQYQQDFWKAYDEVRARKGHPILCGGTGLYIESILKGYRMVPVPENPALRQQLEGKSLQELACMLASMKTLHNTTDIDTPKRAIRAIEIQQYYQDHHIQERQVPHLESLNIGIFIDRDQRRQRISERLRYRLERQDMIGEVRRLLEHLEPEDLIYYGLEYKYLTLYCTGQLSYEEMFSQLETAIHQFAKRQMTWFRGMERRGTPIHWIDASLPMQEKVDQVMRLIREQ